MNEKNISSNKEEDLSTNSNASVANNDVSCTSSASNASATGDDATSERPKHDELF